MNVSVDGMRHAMARSYKGLCHALNDSIKQDEPINPDVIQEYMKDLKMTIGTFCACYNDNDPDFQDISEQIGELPGFNPQS